MSLQGISPQNGPIFVLPDTLPNGEVDPRVASCTQLVMEVAATTIGSHNNFFQNSYIGAPISISPTELGEVLELLAQALQNVPTEQRQNLQSLVALGQQAVSVADVQYTEAMKKLALIEACVSLTGFTQKSLQRAHNELAHEIQTAKRDGTEVNHLLLRKIVIGAGFLGTIFLGVIETIVRFILATIIVTLIGGALMLCGNNDLGSRIVILAQASAEYTMYNIAQAAVSLYSHCAYSDKSINYEMQANYYLYGGESEKSSQTLNLASRTITELFQ